MKYLSLCSGIEAATVAWHPLGWEAVAYSEIERFPSEVLAHHYPSTPNLGDMTKFKEWNFESDVDLLVGGTPCQSFSVAGLRKGLDDPRGNLMLTYLAIADKYRPRWLVWENVPGVLSSNGGKDFGVFLGALGELGYGFAYRILDAQYFGVAQRRRRVFVVGYLGDWRAAAAVLFERHSLQGHPAPSREKREDTSATITARTGVSRNNHEECVTSAPKGFYETGFAQYQKADIGGTIKASGGALGGGSETFLAQPIAFSGQMSNPQTDVDMTQTLQAKNPMAVCLGGQHPNAGIGIEQSPTLTNAMGAGGGHVPITNAMAVGTDLYNGAITGEVACTMSTHGGDGNGTGPTVMQPIPFDTTQITSKANFSNPKSGDPCHPLAATAHVPAIVQPMAVRRLTPVECERLQGFPDSYTDIKSKDKPTPDGPRYKALGNSMAVPVMAWIGERINQVEVICQHKN